MSEIIHSTYELKQKLGQGGGGIVYLAEHLNLRKKVVLKADRRMITTRPELLRREVDVLKNLHHAYIPQVYDFFVENGTVYTVMEYVDGESLDIPLKRGETFSQPQVISWARQILEALEYLHKPIHGDPPKGYIHSDIKPANLMRKPNNEICLIDFNIALALGEAQAVGHSAGYASPEHYGIDYSSGSSSDPLTSETVYEALDAAPQTNSHHTDPDATVTVQEDPDLTVTVQEDPDATVTVQEDPDATVTVQEDPDATVTMQEDPDATVTVQEKLNMAASQELAGLQQQAESPLPHCSSGKTKRIVPDLRSDIYMVGATMYHLLSGKKPAKDAREVIPLSQEQFSPQLCSLIMKAMNPNPDYRFQTAREMRNVLDHLHETDSRIVQFRKKRKRIYAALISFTAIGLFTFFVGMKRIQTSQVWENMVSAAESQLDNGDADEALQTILKVFPKRSGLFTPKSPASAQCVLANTLGVYDLAAGYKPYQTVSLPSELLHLSVAPDGKTALCMYAFETAVIDTECAEIMDTIPMAESALAETAYLDNDTVICAAKNGIAAYSISQKKTLWQGQPATGLAVSADGTRCAGIYRDESRAVIYDTENGTVIREISFSGKKQRVVANDVFANPNDNLFALNEDGSKLAVSFDDGSAELFQVNSGEAAVLTDGTMGAFHFEGGFVQNHLAFSASSSEKSVFSVFDTETMQQAYGYESNDAFGVLTDSNGILLQVNQNLMRIDPETGSRIPAVDASEPIRRFASGSDCILTASKTGFQFYAANDAQTATYQTKSRPDFLAAGQQAALVGSMDSSVVRILKYEANTDAEVLHYDTNAEQSHLEARLSADKKTAMLFNYQRFSIYDSDGKVIVSQEIPDAEQVYDQQYLRESGGAVLEVTYNSGRIIRYSATDGNVQSDLQGERPDSSLDEVLETDSFRISAPLHGTPEVFDKRSGKLLSPINEDAYLTYATEVNGFLILQFLNADGTRYGQVLDQDFHLIARLPYLSDVIGDELMFDYPDGCLRISKLYNLNALLDTARQKGT